MSTKLLRDSIAWPAAMGPVLAFSMCGLAAAQSAIPPAQGTRLRQDWVATDGFPGIQTFSNAYAVTTWDPDGNGPLAERLVAGGEFHYIADQVTDTVAAFNPELGRWEDLGGGVDMPEVGKNGEVIDTAFVNALGTFQDDLIVGGFFNDAGGVAVQNIGRWDGASWSAMGSGLAGFPIAMIQYNGELIVAGTFVSAGGVTVNHIARWNAASWQPLGSPAGMNAPVFGLAVYNGELIAVGQFTSAGGVPASRVARWNGSQWQPLGSGTNNAAHGIAVLGSDLYVGGDFTLAGGVPLTKGVARWDGTHWHPVAGGPFSGVADLIVFQGDLIASGVFITSVVGGPARHIARLDTPTQTWHTMEGGFNTGAGPSSLVVHNGELIAAGGFSKAGKCTVRGLARWLADEGTWARIAPGFNITPSHFITYRGELVAGGGFQSAGDVNANGVARWDGADWHALGNGIHLAEPDAFSSPSVFSLGVYGDELFVGGNFALAGGVPVHHIAAWDGATETWSDVGGGVSGVELPRVNALVVYDGELVAGGDFALAGGLPAASIARWNGAQWQPLAGGYAGIINAMIVHERDLIVTGSGLDGMQRWDGAAWHDMPNGPNGFSLAIYDGQLISGFLDPFAWDGATWTKLPGWSWDPNGAAVGIFEFAVFGGELVVAGQFENAAGIDAADGLVRFNGTSWHALDTVNGTMDSITSALGVHQGELFTNGRVIHADGSISNWRRLASGWSHLNLGLAGGDGVPVLDGTGDLAPGCEGTLSLRFASPSSPALLFAAFESSPKPFKGGQLAAWPFAHALPLTTDPNGELKLRYTWPSSLVSGTPVYLQVAVQDRAAPNGVSLSNALKGVAQ